MSQTTPAPLKGPLWKQRLWRLFRGQVSAAKPSLPELCKSQNGNYLVQKLLPLFASGNLEAAESLFCPRGRGKPTHQRAISSSAPVVGSSLQESRVREKILDELRTTFSNDDGALTEGQTLAIAVAGRDCRQTHTLLILRMLHALGVDMNARDIHKSTPLFYAAKEGLADVVEWLLQEGHCDADHRDKWNQNALYFAVKNGPVQTKHREVLEDYSANMRTLHPQKAAHMKENPRLRIIRALLRHGANPDVISTNSDEINRMRKLTVRDWADKHLADYDRLVREELKLRQRHERDPSKMPPLPLEPEAQAVDLRTECARAGVLFSQPDAVGRGCYMVQHSRETDADQLHQLESDFIAAHSKMVKEEGVLKGWADFGSNQDEFRNVVCKAVGLNTDDAQRKKTIKGLARRKDVLACTLKVAHFEIYPRKQKDAATPWFLSAAEPLVVGYLYQKSKNHENTAGKDADEYDDCKDDMPTVEVSHLKVHTEHSRRGVAVMLFCGLIKHLETAKVPESNGGGNLAHLVKDIRLSVFKNNEPANNLYKKLGFSAFGDPWESDLQGWNNRAKKSKGKAPSDDEDEEEMRKVGWIRYRRCDADARPDTVLRDFMKCLSPSGGGSRTASQAGKRGSGRDHGDHAPHPKRTKHD